MKVRDKKESLKPGREHIQGKLLDFLPLKTILSHFDRALYEVNGVINQWEERLRRVFSFSECSFHVIISHLG